MYFLHSGFVTTFAWPANRLSPDIFHCIEYSFYYSWFLSNGACPEKKNRVAQQFFAILNILFSFRIFEQLALALKYRGCPEYTVLNIYFVLFRIFEQLAFALKNRVCPEFTLLNMYFLLFRILSNLRLPWKTEGALNSLHWICVFYYSGFLSNSRLPWKTELPWKCSLYGIYFLNS